MAKPTTRRQTNQFMTVVSEGIVPQPLTHCVPAKGMNTQLRLNQMGRDTARLVQNLRIRDQHYISRDGTAVVGTIADSELIYATSVKLSTGTTWSLRWRVDGIDALQSGVWTPIAGDSFTAPSSTQVSITGWGDGIVFTIGVDRLFWLRFEGGVPSITRLVESPENVGHVTTFAGRIIASIRNSGETHWCAKNDNEDWTGQGSGFEDLRSAPGGGVDQQTAVAPVTDEYAYMVRTNSVWQMSLTGDPDAPFRFTLLYQGVGSEYPGTVKSLNRGVAFMSRDSIVHISPEGKQDIGQGIREKIRITKQYLRDTSSDYDPRDNEYVLSIPSANSLNAHELYRYNFDAPGWTKDVYPFPVKSISFVRYSRSLSMDELTGLPMDALEGAMDDLGVTDRIAGLMFAVRGNSKLVIVHSDTNNNTGMKDVNSVGFGVASGWRIETGYVIPSNTINRVWLTATEIEYESEAECELTYEYSDDGGATWNQYASSLLPIATRPTVHRVQQSLEREGLQIAINCASSPNFRLIAVRPYASSGAAIEDAR